MKEMPVTELYCIKGETCITHFSVNPLCDFLMLGAGMSQLGRCCPAFHLHVLCVLQVLWLCFLSGFRHQSKLLWKLWESSFVFNGSALKSGVQSHFSVSDTLFGDSLS